MPSCSSSCRAAGLVLRVVRLPPAADHRPGGGDHHVEHPLAGRDLLGELAGGEADPGTQLVDVRPGRAARPARTPCPRDGCSRPEARLSRVVLPAPFGPRTTQRSSSSTCQDRLRTRKLPLRITLTRSNARTVSSSGGMGHGRLEHGSIQPRTARRSDGVPVIRVTGGRAEDLVADRVQGGAQGAVQHRLGLHLGHHDLGRDQGDRGDLALHPVGQRRPAGLAHLAGQHRPAAGRAPRRWRPRRGRAGRPARRAPARRPSPAATAARTTSAASAPLEAVLACRSP